MAFNWTCPHCGIVQAVVDSKRRVGDEAIYIADLSEGNVSIVYDAIGCSNESCKKLTLTISLRPNKGSSDQWKLIANKFIMAPIRLVPRSESKPQPDFIPAPIREDYLEACLIRDDSPKAAATLIRRCLQGMIRDYTGISKARLIDEIKALKEAMDAGKAPDGVTHDSVDAIDAVRGIGNIGAHMEKDINVIVDVDSGEAQALIELVEMLFEEWYVARYKRQQRLQRIQDMAAAKKLELDAQKQIASLLKSDGDQREQ